jgi:hypothetical protein
MIINWTAETIPWKYYALNVKIKIILLFFLFGFCSIQTRDFFPYPNDSLEMPVYKLVCVLITRYCSKIQ